jgi:hypothetical protein
MLFQILTGLSLGALHVLSGPDHLAAVAPLSFQRSHGVWAVGFRWGLGHSSGVLMVGVLAMFLREVLPIERISAHAEWLVGIVLIGIGLWGIRKALTYHLHTHPHTHEGRDHVHTHLHGGHSAHPQAQPKAHRHTHAAFAVGTLHGLAGGSHFLGVLPALAFPSKWQTVAYLLAFAIGTIAAMTCFSSMMGLAARGCAHTGNQLYRNLMLGCSSAAVVIGGYWLIG